MIELNFKQKKFLTCYLHEYSCIFANPWASKLIITWPCLQQSEAAWLHSSLLCHKQCSCPSCHFHCQNLSQQLINLSVINQSSLQHWSHEVLCMWMVYLEMFSLTRTIHYARNVEMLFPHTILSLFDVSCKWLWIQRHSHGKCRCWWTQILELSLRFHPWDSSTPWC
jgi:hypothetical protein